jgi:hypothetical protein
MIRRFRTTPKLKPGDVVVRCHRLLKTQGIILRFDGEDENGASRAWIKWNHPTTLPNPSLETVDDVELVGEHSGTADPEAVRSRQSPQ